MPTISPQWILKFKMHLSSNKFLDENIFKKIKLIPDEMERKKLMKKSYLFTNLKSIIRKEKRLKFKNIVMEIGGNTMK